VKPMPTSSSSVRSLSVRPQFFDLMRHDMALAAEHYRRTL
jgi:hypothetical protein